MGRTGTTKQLSIHALRSKYQNDNTHTDHVTALALALFDVLSRHFNLKTRERSILEAAARLHDIGYSVSPTNHRQVGANLVLTEGLKSFTQSECQSIATVMLLHAGEVQYPRPSKPISRLGAMLRVADGLDYGHIQDVSLKDVEVSPQRIRLHVSAPHFPENIMRARKKADLWLYAFDTPVEILPVDGTDESPAALVDRATPLAEAARRLLAQQFRRVVANTSAALSSADPQPLHDIRVSLRRFSILAKTFQKPLNHTSLEHVERSLRHLNKALGPVRDRDVLIAFLKKLPETLQKQPGLPQVLQHHETLREQLQPLLHQYLDKPSFPDLKAATGTFLRIEIPHLPQRKRATLRKLASGSLRKRLTKALELKRLRQAKSPERIHRLRITIRKARYLADAFAPILGRPILKLARRARAAEQVLGRLHDADVFQHRLLTEGPPPPRALIKHLDHCHRDCQEKLGRAWDRFEKAATNKAVRKLLT